MRLDCVRMSYDAVLDSLALTLLSTGYLASAGGNYQNSTIKIWNWSTGQLVQSFSGQTIFVNSLTSLKNGYLVSCNQDATIKLWNAKDGVLIRNLTGHYVDVVDARVLEDGNLATGQIPILNL